MAATYENNVNNNNVYEDNYSEISKGVSSSTSSFAEETKRISILDDKETNSLSKRNKRHTFMSKFKKDDKEKEEKEKLRSESGMSRPLSGIFSKDKDNNKRNSIIESTNHINPTPRTPSTNSDVSKNRRSYVFFSEDEEKHETDTNSKRGIKSRQISNAEGLEKDKLTKKEKRLSVLGKFMSFNESKSQKSKNDVWEDGFIEPEETKISSKFLRNPFPSLKNKQNKINNNESSQAIQHDNFITGIITDEPESITDDNPVDDVQSTTSSSQQSSTDDQYFTNNKHENESTATTPITPVTPKIIESESAFEFRIEELQQEKVYKDNSNVADFGKQKNDAFTNTIDQQGYETNTRMLQELATLNKSLSDLNYAKDQLEARVAEQNNQLIKFNSMEQIMQEQVDLSKRTSELVQRLESKVNVPKEESDGLSSGKMFEDTIRRLENKIDRQNDELIRLKSIVGQLTGGNQQLLLTNEDISHQNLAISEQVEERALIQTNRSTQIYSRRTLVSTLVVSPLCNTITISASIATSVLYAVYVRPVVGLVSVLRDISTTKCETTD